MRRNFLFSLANQGGQALVLWLIMVMVARALGPEGKGAFALAIALPTFLAGAALMSLPAGLSYWVSGRRAAVGVLAADALLYLAVMGGAVTLAVWLLRDPLVHALRLDFAPGLWRWVVLLILPTFVAELGAGLLAGQRRFGCLALANTGAGAIFAVVFAVGLFAPGGDVHRACLLFVVYRLVRGLALWAATPWRDAGPLRPDAAALRGMLWHSGQGHVGTVMQMAVYRLDLLLVNAMAGVASAGLYSAGTLVAEAIAQIAQGLGLVVLPEVASRERDEGARMAARTFRQTACFTVAAALALAALAPVLVPLFFGAEFRPAVVAVWWLLPGIVGLSLTRVIVPAVFAGGWPWAGSAAAALGLVLTVVLDLLLIPRYDFAGAAAASSVAYVSQTVLMLALFRRQSGLAYGEVWRVRRSDFVVLRDALARVTGA